MPELRIDPASIDEIMRTSLLDELDADLGERYPGEPIFGIDPIRFRASGGYFVLASYDGRPVGCGAFRPLDARTVEIKRMFVRPEFRGRGIARSILGMLEAEASRRGHARSVLETAARQPEAIALYRRCGYAPIEAFGPYAGNPRALCFGKDLDGGQGHDAR
jgi:putative acetyltransferase